MPVEIRRASIDDAGGMADLHLRAFEGFFLNSLGWRFLRQLYSSYVRASDACHVAMDEGRVVGLVVGMHPAAGQWRSLICVDPFGWTMQAAITGLRRPWASLLLVRRMFAQPTAPGLELYRGSSILASLAVSPSLRSGGVGRALVREFLGDVREHGSVGVLLETDAEENAATNRFYEAIGWTLLGQYSRSGGRLMNEYYFAFQGKD